MKFNKIERDGYAISIQHFPDKKRPVICAEFPDVNAYLKVAEVTNEEMLVEVIEALFYDAKVVER